MLYEVMVDGASRGKNSTAACAFVIYKNRKKIAQFTRPLGKASNNAAEYEAVIHALLACSMSDVVEPIIYSDSAVVVNQVNGKWECKNPNLIPLLMSVKILEEAWPFRLVQVPRAFVHEADYLCSQCLNQLETFTETRKI